METYSLIIIGGGAGAFAAAIKANYLGVKTALINDGLPLGGTCVNVGCVPSKTLLHAAELLHKAKNHHITGIELAINKADYASVVADEIALVDQLRAAKYEQILAGLDNITYIKGLATFIANNQIKVGEQILQADKFIIATGSKAIIPEIEGLSETGYITHIEAMKLKALPKRLAVIGAGPVGLELAQMYARFGAQVTILQRSKTILPNVEPELVNRLTEILEAEGLTIKTAVSISKVIKSDGAKLISYDSPAGEETIIVDEILIAAGKKPNTEHLNLELVGVAVDARKAIITQPTLQTSQAHIYAVGDVTNLPLRLETTAGREGTYAVDNLINGLTKSIDYNSVPWTVFTDPQLASVGLTENQQMEQLKVCACRSVNFDKLPKALITKRTEGVIKMAIHPETSQIMGIHILGPDAGDLIAQAMVLIKNNNTVDDVLDSLPVFPTMSEAIKLVAMSFTQDISKLSCCI